MMMMMVMVMTMTMSYNPTGIPPCRYIVFFFFKFIYLFLKDNFKPACISSLTKRGQGGPILYTRNFLL